MNMMTGISMPQAALKPPIALLRALPAGPLAQKYQRLKRLADLFAAFDRDDMELAVELLLAEMDASDGDPDLEDSEGTHGDILGTAIDVRGNLLLTELAAALRTDDDEDGADTERNGDEHDTGDSEEEELTEEAHRAADYWHRGPGCYLSDIPEPSLAVSEANGGGWRGNLGASSDVEPWFVPVTLNDPMAANDRVTA